MSAAITTGSWCHTPLYAVAFSYQRVEMIKTAEFRALFPPEKEKADGWRFYHDLWGRTVAHNLTQRLPTSALVAATVSPPLPSAPQRDRSGYSRRGVDDLCPENRSAKDDVAAEPTIDLLCRDDHYMAKCYVVTNGSTLSTNISTSSTAYMGNIIAVDGTFRANTDCPPHTGTQD